MADGTVEFSVWLDVDDAEKELNAIKKKIIDLEATLNSQQNVKTGLEEALARAGAAADEAKAKLEQMREIGASKSEISRQELLVKDLDKQFDAAAKAVERQNAKIDETNAKLDAEKERYAAIQQMAMAAGDSSEEAAQRAGSAAREAGDEAVGATERVSRAGDVLASKFEKVINRISGLAKRVLFFNLFTMAFRKLRAYLLGALQTSQEFSAALASLKGSLATAFQPILSAVIPALTQLISWLNQVVAAVASFVSLLFGTTVRNSAAAAKAMNAEAAAIKGVGGAAGGAAKQLAAFDELNILSSSGGGGGGSGVGVDYAQLESEAALTGRLAELVNSLNFEPLLTAFGRVKEAASGLADTLKKGLGWAWDNILVPLAHWTIEKLAPQLLNLLAAAFDFLRAVLEKLGPILTPLWENVLKPLFKAAGEIIVTGLGKLTELLGDLTKLINGDISWDEFIEGLDGVKLALLALGGVAVLSAIGGMSSTLIGSVGGMIKYIKTKGIPQLTTQLGKLAKAVGIGSLAVADAVLVAYDVSKLKEASKAYSDAQKAHAKETESALENYRKLYETKGKEVADEWAKMVYNIDTTGSSLEEAQKQIAGTIEGYWEDVPQNMWEGFKQGWNYYFGEDGKGLWQLCKDAFNNLLEWVKDLLGIKSPSTEFYDIGSNVVQGFLDGFEQTWASITTKIQNLWNGLVTWVKSLFGIKSKINGEEGESSTFLSIGKSLASGIKTGFQTVWNDLVGWIETQWNNLKNWWNSLTLNAPEIKGTTQTDTGHSHSSGTFKSILNAPGLAAGAVIPPNREFLAVLGDQSSGYNIETPLETMLEAFRLALTDGDFGTSNITIYLDGEEIARNTVQRINRNARGTGKLGLV